MSPNRNLYEYLEEKMKDDALKEAINELEKEARNYCKEKDLDPEKAVFTLRISKNLKSPECVLRETGINDLIEFVKVTLEGSRSDAMLFIVDDDPGLASHERAEGEKYIEEKKAMRKEMGSSFFIEEAKATLERVRKGIKDEKIVFANILEADVHVQVSYLNPEKIKFFCLI